MWKSSTNMCRSSGSHFFRTTTVLQSGLDTFDAFDPNGRPDTFDFNLKRNSRKLGRTQYLLLLKTKKQ